MSIFVQRSSVDPVLLGLPTRDELVDLRIWDLHYHGTDQHEEVLPYLERMGIERLFSLDIGTWAETESDQETDERHRSLLDSYQSTLAGITRVDPSRPEDSIERMNRWIADGPAVGIKYANRMEADVTSSHPDNFAIIERAAELDALVYIHTWILVGGEPRTVDGGMKTGESTPMDVAMLAEEFPDQPLICGHQGGDWELGIRAVRPHENVFLEFSGGKPASGAVDFAVQELGIDRLVWGGHLPSRSYANEMAKVFDADLSDREREKIFGENLRRLAAPIMQRKGYDVSI